MGFQVPGFSIERQIENHPGMDYHSSIKSEDEMIAGRLNDLLLVAYGNIGYDIVMVPVMPVEDRTNLVLEGIN